MSARIAAAMRGNWIKYGQASGRTDQAVLPLAANAGGRSIWSAWVYSEVAFGGALRARTVDSLTAPAGGLLPAQPGLCCGIRRTFS
jgi:hypothetical protein